MASLPGADSGHYPEDLELTLLQVVHRHGERTPVRKRLEKLFPTVWKMCDANAHMFATIVSLDPSAQKQFVPLQRLVDEDAIIKKPHVHSPGACYYGQLTNLGRHSMATLGARLREIYVDRLKFLPDIYDQSMVTIRSTDYQRTQESVQQLVAGGLYPADKRGDDFVLQIATRDPVVENMFPNPNCYRLRQLAKEFKKEVDEKCKDKFESLTERLKNHVDSVSLDSHPSANGILDTLVAARAHGFELPVDIDDGVIRDLEDVVVLEWFHGVMRSDEARRLSTGRIVGEIRDRMAEKAIGVNDRKLHVYSGHDTTVGPLLISLGGFDNRWPPFSSSVIFELFKQKGASPSWTSRLFGGQEKGPHFVRVRYNDKILELPGCQAAGDHHESGDKSLCTFEAFQKIVKDQVPDNWKEECAYRS
ncbi:histidine phosphatase superfamily [Zychaea mexicana]|uniref:histidine phosphatase superfamily n=1 Tax=Zychaea mexicana TaxID=64656 RepID=UPI0022FEE419|nr:histidine phosphatase superfamily [Zychaea mexicana]KAI9492688.1 histidine phosphatase superfamily [Zychaea mexicana]